MLFDGTAIGKGLNVKGKSALKGPLAGFVPFLQISEEAHKAMVGTSPKDARVRVYYRNPIARETARERLQEVMLEMAAGAREGAQAIERAKTGEYDALPAEMQTAAERAVFWECSSYELIPLDGHADKSGDGTGSSVYGLEVPERVLWEAYVVRQDISDPPGWETGRPSEPGFMDLNLRAVRDNSEPRAVIWQDDGQDPMNPRRLLVAHEEIDWVKPVASDIDAFLIGSKGMAFGEPLPPEQLQQIEWLLERIELVLSTPAKEGWNRRWLEVLKESVAGGQVRSEMPRYGYGDPQSYNIMKKAVQRLKFCGGVRHGAECFNYWFPQELDEEFLVVWEGFQSYGSQMPWRYVDQAGLRSFLLGRLEDGFAFPLNPKWILCDEGWAEIFHAIRAAPHARRCLETWLPPASGLAERILQIAALHPEGFKPLNPNGEQVDQLDSDAAEWELSRHLVLKRAKVKLRAIFAFGMIAQRHKQAPGEATDGTQGASEE